MPDIPHADNGLHQPINNRWQLLQLRGAACGIECSNACKESPTLSSAHGAASSRCCDHCTYAQLLLRALHTLTTARHIFIVVAVICVTALLP